jgi:3-oxoacyl-[acyl-carrier protein] reductase
MENMQTGVPGAELAGRTALVTGSSHGIGTVVARELARCGAAVAVHGRDAAAAASVADDIRQSGGTSVAVTGDVTDVGALERIREEVHEGIGTIDVLVAAAGGSHTRAAPIEDISEDEWRAAIDGNLLATFLTLRCFLPEMKENGRGSIVALGSSGGRVADARVPAPYAAAKAGVIQLTRQVALQAGPSGVRANCLAPETILTDAIAARISDEQRTWMINAHPLRRLGTPADVADAVVFLAGDRSSWITGAVLDLTGGAVVA